MTRAVDEADAPDWAAVGLGVEDGLFQIHILRGALGCTELGVSIVRLAPHTKVTTGHAHPAGEEVYVLVAGRAELKAGEEVVPLEPLGAVRLPGPTLRALRNPGDEEAVLVVASYPQDTPAAPTFVQAFWAAEPGETPVAPRLTRR
jgi:quercetin dioxygenase-like cupin family protein